VFFFITLVVSRLCFTAGMTKSIQHLPKTKRPRERLFKTGVANLTQAELLAIVLGSGTSKRNVLSLSKQIMAKFGKKLSHQITLKELTSIHGIGPIQGSRILAMIEFGKRTFRQQLQPRILQPSDVLTQVNEIRTSHREQLLGLYLNARYEMMAKEVLAVGSVNTHQVEPRDVLAPAIKLPCRSLILVHNHPSGDPTPSPDDITTTARLKKAGQIMGVNLLDHLIVTADDYLSLKQQRLL
jgi:DNA repair protein RadC